MNITNNKKHLTMDDQFFSIIISANGENKQEKRLKMMMLMFGIKISRPNSEHISSASFAKSIFLLPEKTFR